MRRGAAVCDRAERLRAEAGGEAVTVLRYTVSTDGCWLWKGRLDRRGRPLVPVGDSLVSAHRYVYERKIAALADGIEIDTTCHRATCVNPAHLVPRSRGLFDA